MDNSKESVSSEILNDDIKAMFVKIQAQQQDLKKRTDQISDIITTITNKSHKELEDILANPQNFTKQEWKKIQEMKAENQKKLEDIYISIGLDYNAEHSQQIVKEAQKKRRRLIGKKKNWISIN